MNLATLIQEYRLAVSATAIPFRLPHDRERAKTWDDDAIHFAVQVLGVKPRGDDSPVVVWRGCYSVGAAHPEIWAERDPKTKRRFWQELKAVCNNPRSNDAVEGRKRIREAYQRAAPITLRDILESLALDVSSVGEGFRDWAFNFGYDQDSLAAWNLYRSCEDTRDGMSDALGYGFLSDLASVDFDEEDAE